MHYGRRAYRVYKLQRFELNVYKRQTIELAVCFEIAWK